jgi:hypothetical protein
MGDIATFTDKEVLQRQNNGMFSYHAWVETRGARAYWRETLGDNFILLIL